MIFLYIIIIAIIIDFIIGLFVVVNKNDSKSSNKINSNKKNEDYFDEYRKIDIINKYRK